MTDMTQFSKMSVAELTTPRNGRTMVCDHWWIVTPERDVLFYCLKGFFTPQCNTDKRLLETDRICVNFGIEFIPVAYVPSRRPSLKEVCRERGISLQGVKEQTDVVDLLTGKRGSLE